MLSLTLGDCRYRSSRYLLGYRMLGVSHPQMTCDWFVC
jgi:hypothetical protein